MQDFLADNYERIPPGIALNDIQTAIRHAISCFPEECCGALTLSGYKPLTNIAEDRINFFRIKESQVVACRSNEILALFHSHTTGNAFANKDDMLMQIASGKPHGVCVIGENDGRKKVMDVFFWGSSAIPNLLGRKYRPVTMDCFSLIRDAYRSWYGIVIPDVPRDHDSLERGERLYETGFRDAGFREIPLRDIAPGDVLLGKILSANFNHGALVIDNKHIIHHYRDRLSRRDELSQWAQVMQTCLRHNSFPGLPMPPTIQL